MPRIDQTDINALILEFQSGKVSAFDQIFNKFYSPLCYFGSRIVQDKFTAEDLVQDIFVKLWHKNEDFDSLETIKSFLYVSVRNACLNYIEKSKVKAKHANYVISQGQVEEETILHSIIEAEILREIFDTVDTLPEQCRKVIRMTFEEGKKPKEIADELGITVSTVNNQKMRGLGLLKNRLSDDGLALRIALFFPEVIHLLK